MVTSPDTLLIDIDGVLVVSWEPIAGAVEALGRVRARGTAVRFLTNTTSRTRSEIVSALTTAGFEVATNEVFTATSAAAAHLRLEHAGARCLFLNHGDVTDDLDGVELVGPDDDPGDVGVVLVGGAGPEFSYNALNHALDCLVGGASLVAAHRNLRWQTVDGLRLDAGPYVEALERASGVRATVVGKPAPAMFDAALASVGGERSASAMVGDDLESDVRGAQAVGITGVQVRTGKFRAEQLDDGGVPPDVVLDSFASVPEWLEGDQPPA